MALIHRPEIKRYLALGFPLLALIHLGWGPTLDPIKSRYTKSEYGIRVRDGKKLFTAVYLPKDKSKSYPILLNRTPYGVAPYGTNNYPDVLGPSEKFSQDGFIFVYQDVRGRMMSEGEFTNMTPHKEIKQGSADIDESTDTFDTIEWLIQNTPNNNGRVGLWGISYPGFYAAAGMIDAHPALKAVSPQAPISDWFIGDDFHHNGAFYLPHAFGFLASFGRPRPRPTKSSNTAFDFGTTDGYSFYLNMGPLANANYQYFKYGIAFWNDLMEHGNYDAFWQARNIRPHLKNIRPAVMTVGGWYDAEDLFGALNTYQSIERSSPGAYNILVMGPWFHGGWNRADGETLGNVSFGSRTSVFYRDEIEFPFFAYFLKGAGRLNLPEAFVFETGRNEWRRESEWPPRQAVTRPLYFQSGGKLSWDTPPEDAPTAFDEYVSDPAKPVPYIGGTAIGMAREYMVEDQRFASVRADVLTYQTDPLTSDITVAGPIVPSLQVSTSGTDCDWIVKLIDVYPENPPDSQDDAAVMRMGGFQQLVRGDVMRGKFRNSFDRPEPFTPGVIAKVEFSMPDIFHTFRKAHRIMVQVQSSWFPLVDRNPQRFLDIYSAKESDFQKAVQRLYRSNGTPSQVKINLLGAP
jgi:putative CocE/NonD family hydrolase